MVQWLRLHAPNAGGPGSVPGQGTRSHMHAATKSPHAASKTRRSQINIYFKKRCYKDVVNRRTIFKEPCP